MNKKTLKKIIFSLVLIVLVTPIMVCAEDPAPTGGSFDPGEDKLGGLNLDKPTDGTQLITDIINWILGFLALIAVIIILIAGFEWMTAGGNDKKVETAQKRLKYGLIGLVIIFFAYGIVTFVFQSLRDVPT